MLELQKSLAAEPPGAQEMPEGGAQGEAEECPDAYLMKRPFKVPGQLGSWSSQICPLFSGRLTLKRGHILLLCLTTWLSFGGS